LKLWNFDFDFGFEFNCDLDFKDFKLLNYMKLWLRNFKPSKLWNFWLKVLNFETLELWSFDFGFNFDLKNFDFVFDIETL